VEDARVAFRQAITLAGQPGSWLYWLNYGLACEQAGLPQDALDAYQTAIGLRPSIAEAALWQASDVRQRALAAWSQETAERATTDMLARGFDLLDQGETAQAQAVFERAWHDGERDSALYRGLALTAAARGEAAFADAYFTIAVSAQSVENESKVLPLLDWADYAARTGQTDAAHAHYEAAYAAVFDANLYGWGSSGFSAYAWFVFNREGLPNDLLPQLARADVSPELAARFLPLGQLREAAGDTDGAAVLYRSLLEFDPQLAEAQSRLAALGGR
jgi:tetratricopeptide (TPR) repeat protein